MALAFFEPLALGRPPPPTRIHTSTSSWSSRVSGPRRSVSDHWFCNGQLSESGARWAAAAVALAAGFGSRSSSSSHERSFNFEQKVPKGEALSRSKRPLRPSKLQWDLDRRPKSGIEERQERELLKYADRYEARAPVGMFEEVPLSLRPAAEVLFKGLKVNIPKCTRLAATLQRYVVATEQEDPNGMRTRGLARRLIRGLEQHPAMRQVLFAAPGGVIKVVKELQLRSARHTERFETIREQHEAVSEGEDGEMEEYTDASAYIGDAWWVRVARNKMVQWIDEYFLLTPQQLLRGYPRWAFNKGILPKGWKRYTLQGRTGWWNPETKRLQSEAPPRLDAAETPPGLEPPVLLLDIGSCTNGFTDYSDLVLPFALDLSPSSNSTGIYKADFFEVPIVDPESQPPGERFVVGPDGELQAIVAGSFEVAVISLVLSYVPTPGMRIEMVAKARSCLRDNRGLLMVMEVGSALADKSWYHGDAAAEWSRAIEGAGFRVLKFQDMIREGPKKQNACLWVFETAPVPDEVLKPLYTPRDYP